MFTAYPDKGPEISGTQAHYLPGDYITANCTSGKSNPPAELEWLINGAKVPTTSCSVCLSATEDESEVSNLSERQYSDVHRSEDPSTI